MTGAPASFDVFAVSPEGFDVHSQLNGEKVYTEAHSLLERLVADGFKPREQRRQSRPAKTPDGPPCPVHGVPFRTYNKDGKTWQAHRQGDGWCHNANKEQAA